VHLSISQRDQRIGRKCSKSAEHTYANYPSRSAPGAVLSHFTGLVLITILQVHWQDYSQKEYIYAFRHLRDIQSEGLISTLGLCNFDSIRADEICTDLGKGVIVSNQVQVRYNRD
jgi:hypothetical protein